MTENEKQKVRRIAAAARNAAGGNPWRAYELAKRLAMAELPWNDPRMRDLSARLIADELGI